MRPFNRVLCRSGTFARFSLLSYLGIMIGHVTPEAYDGGTIALVHEGDTVVIDAIKKTLELVRHLFSLSNPAYTDHCLYSFCLSAS